jgi:hypothetical protein
MKVAIFTYKQLKELLDKPSDDATRKWVDSRGLQRRNRENSNVKEVLVPYELYTKLWESAGKPPDFSSPPVDDVPEDTGNSSFEDDSVLNAEFSSVHSYVPPEEAGKNTYALSTEFTEEFIKDLAAKQNILMDKNDTLYNRISELTRYEERARILEEEIRKKEEELNNYKNKIDNLTCEIRQMDVIKIKMDLVQELASLKESEVNELKDKINSLNVQNRSLEEELEKERTRYQWIRKFIGI